MPLRPSNPPQITIDDLMPGDILLSTGTDWIDQLILHIDQGDYTHTTYYVGKVDGVYRAVDATTDGIIYDTVQDDWVQVLVDAYRFVSPDGHHVGDTGWPVDPVTTLAKSFVGGAYSNSELIMGGLLFLTMEMPSNPVASEMIRMVGDRLVHEMQEFIQYVEGQGKTPMTCVQVATSAFWGADPSSARKYGIEVKINGARKAPWSLPSNASADLKALSAKRDQLAQLMGPFAMEPAKKPGIVVKAGSDMLPLGSCTTRDLQTSPSLQFVGCLLDKRS